MQTAKLRALLASQFTIWQMFGLDMFQSINDFKGTRTWTRTEKTAGVCQLVGSCPFRLHSQYACHILAKQYIFQRWFIHVWCYVISRIYFPKTQQVTDEKNSYLYMFSSDNNFHLYSNPVFPEYFVLKILLVYIVIL